MGSDHEACEIYHLENIQASERMAKCLSGILRAGDTLALCGDLGAGKTSLTGLILGNWGITDVTSPTFTLLHSYISMFMVHHLDFYRIESADELYHLGWDDVQDGKSLVIVEWMDRFPEIYPDNYLQIFMAYTGEGRDAYVCAGGARGREMLRELKRCGITGN